MNTELKNAVLATDLKAQYDACAKKLLGYKDILAQILIGAVEEFQRMSPEEVKPEKQTISQNVSGSVS